MSAQTLECPNCGAPLEYKGSDPTVRCPFCHTSVVVPEELRQPEIQSYVSVIQVDAKPRQLPKGLGTWITIAVIVVILGIVASIAIPLVATAWVAKSVIGDVNLAQTQRTVEAASEFMLTPAEMPTLVPEPTPTATPSFANPAFTFGKEGIGPGQLNDARYIAVDGEGTVYVADYMGGRIQAFDSSGKYMHQWSVGDENTIISGLAANYQGEVFVAIDRDVVRYSGSSGKELNRMRNSMGGSFGAMWATAEGGVAAMWYEGRWGMITSLEGHRENLMIYSRNGKLDRTIKSPVSELTKGPALDVMVAVDGKGNLYALSDSYVYKYGPGGEYIDRFGGVGDQPGQFDGAYAVAVDGQERVYVGESYSISVFSADGNFLDKFPIQAPGYSLAVDSNGYIWVVSRETVTQYVLKDQ